MDTRITPPEAARMLTAALSAGLVREDDTSLVIHDLDRLRQRVGEALDSFAPGSLHAVAVKANPLPALLRHLATLGPGVGAEAASLPELELALATGFEPERVVFDSPAKTWAEIRYALARGVHLNADNFDELARIAATIAETALPLGGVGLRINPQVGAGTIAATSVAASSSKFGLPLDQCRSDILAAFVRHPWLNALHCHVGSQGCSQNQLVRAAQIMLDLARDITAAGGRVTTLDIGGGLPATYSGTDPKPSISDYATALRHGCPDLFTGSHRLVTEFGRAIHAPCAFAAARVEYVKDYGEMPTAVTHLGADMFLRECYTPEHWHHELATTTADGTLKTTPPITQAIAGPLCFQGDFPARQAQLPALKPGDWVLFLDSGAYTLSMWSRYNSRQMPAVLGISQATGPHFLKPRQTVESVLGSWT